MKFPAHLAVCVDYRSQQLPGASTPVHPHHPQDLQETQAAESRCRKDVALAAGRHHSNRGNEHDDVWRQKKSEGENMSWERWEEKERRDETTKREREEEEKAQQYKLHIKHRSKRPSSWTQDSEHSCSAVCYALLTTFQRWNKQQVFVSLINQVSPSNQQHQEVVCNLHAILTFLWLFICGFIHALNMWLQHSQRGQIITSTYMLGYLWPAKASYQCFLKVIFCCDAARCF